MVKSFFYHVRRCFYKFLKFSSGPYDDQLGWADPNGYLLDLYECREKEVSLIELHLLKVRVVRWPRVAHDSLAPLSVRMRRAQALYKSDQDKKAHWIWIKKITFRDMIQTYEDKKKYRYD